MIQAGSTLGFQTECPHCGDEFYTEQTDSIICPDCIEKFSLNRRTKEPVGVIYTCPHCAWEFYSEYTGRIKCPDCMEYFTGTQKKPNNHLFERPRKNKKKPLMKRVDHFLDKLIRQLGG